MVVEFARMNMHQRLEETELAVSSIVCQIPSVSLIHLHMDRLAQRRCLLLTLNSRVCAPPSQMSRLNCLPERRRESNTVVARDMYSTFLLFCTESRMRREKTSCWSVMLRGSRIDRDMKMKLSGLASRNSGWYIN